jgi:transcriptional regulator with XRE-family HTH domain
VRVPVNSLYVDAGALVLAIPSGGTQPLPAEAPRAANSQVAENLRAVVPWTVVGRLKFPTPRRRHESVRREVVVGERAVKHVRKFLGQRLRALRKQHSLSQERLGERSGLSGKFIGEVERGEKSISIDSLYHVAVALDIPLRELTDVRADKPASVPTEEAEKIFALVSGRRRPEDLRKAYKVLQAMFGRAS